MSNNEGMTLTEFLEARIAEDEAKARAWDAAYNNPGPVPEYHYQIARKHRQEWPTLWESLDNFTPRRVLAECAAKRAIIEQHPRDDDGFCYDSTTHARGCKWAHPCPTLRALAAVYKDHPDYRQEWEL